MTTLGEPSDADLRRRTSIKWSRASKGEIPADIAELDFDLAPEVKRALQEAARRSDVGYPDFERGGPVELGQIFAERTHRRFGWTPDPSRTEVCAQIVQALCCALLAFTRPGGIVLIHRPTYPAYVEAIRALGRKCVTIPTGDVGDAGEFRGGMRPRGSTGPIEMIVLCNPHNPTGHVFSARTLGALCEYAEMNDAIIFVDEVMQDLTYGNVRFASPSTFLPLASRCVTFTSAAKSFNLGGLRCAVGHFGSADLHSRYCRLPWHLRSGASQLGIVATLAAWRYGDQWLGALKTRLERNLSGIAEALTLVPTVRWHPPDAGFFAWLDFSKTVARNNPALHFRSNAGLRLQPGSTFGAEYAAFARLNFGTSAQRLNRVLGRLGSGLVI